MLLYNLYSGVVNKLGGGQQWHTPMIWAYENDLLFVIGKNVRHMPSMAIHVISHAVHTSQDRWYLVWRDFVRPSRRTTGLIIWPYCGKRRSLIYSSLRSGQQGDHHCGRSAIGAEKTFLIPSNITLEGLVAYIFWNLAWYYLTYIWQRKP